MRQTNIYKGLLFGFAALTLTASASAADLDIDGDDTEIPDRDELDELDSRSFDFDGFTGLNIEASMALEIEVGEDFSVTLMTQDDHFDEIEMEVDDGVLVIEHDDDGHDDRHVKLIITMPSLDYFEVDESVLDTEISGVDADEFYLEFEGVGEFDLEGRCNTMNIELTGVGDFDLRDFECREVYGDVSGVGEFNIFASDVIELDISGIGDVTIYGDPDERDVDAIGLGDVDYR